MSSRELLLQDDPLAAIEELPDRVKVPRMGRRFLNDVQHDEPEVGDVDPPFPPVRIRLTRRHIEKSQGDHSVGTLDLLRYKPKTSSADSPGPTCQSAFSPRGKKSNDSPPTTPRNQ